MALLVKAYEFAALHHFWYQAPYSSGGPFPHSWCTVFQLGLTLPFQVWSRDLTWPVKEAHSPNSYDWLSIGHIIQAEPVKLNPWGY